LIYFFGVFIILRWILGGDTDAAEEVGHPLGAAVVVDVAIESAASLHRHREGLRITVDTIM
jgi:hypothetical protein